MFRRVLLPVCLLAFLAPLASATVTLPKLISDHMVFQCDMPVRVWGSAAPGESVRVRFRDQTVRAQADDQGRWELFLQPMDAGGPNDMRVEGNNRLVVRDILVGEVWIASGQSNMRWRVDQSNDADAEIAAAKYPRIRLFQVELDTAGEPRADVTGVWKRCSPESAGVFSAVGYFFGRRLHQELNVPVGIIQSAWGGTPAEAWTSREKLRADPALWFYLNRWDRVLAEWPAARIRYERDLAAWKRLPEADRPPEPRAPRGPGHQHAPAALYNAMVAPLTPYGIRGAIWYQGESNAGADQARLYRRLFRTMIEDWRSRWGQGPFPFLFVQLANYQTGGDWPTLRESQTEALALRNTGMAVTVDIGDPEDIHPRNKQDAGKRLALWALAGTYGRKIVHSGPLYRQMTTEGDRIRLWFDHTGAGLKAWDGALRGFLIAGPDHVFHPAEAAIDGATVVVSSRLVEEPKAVRYAWDDDPPNNLRNSADLPASPFRTDDWTGAILSRE